MPSIPVGDSMYYSGGWKNAEQAEWEALRDLFWDGNKSTSYLYGWTRFDGGNDFYRTGTAWSPLWSGFSVTAGNWGSLGSGSRADTGFFLVSDAAMSDVSVSFAGSLAGLFLLGAGRRKKVVFQRSE